MLVRHLAAVVALAFLVVARPALAEKRLAFVVGNDAYVSLPRLGKAANDARAISEALAKAGFEVTRLENAGRGALSLALSDFDGKIAKGDVVAFFFAGHGFEIRGVNYLLPVDVPPARQGQEELVKDASLAADSVVERFQNRGARTVLMVLDACRDNPFPTQTRSAGTRGLARMDAPDGVFILFSAGAKQSALDQLSDADKDPNSVFTRLFVRELARGDRTLVEIAKATQVGVRDLAGSIGHVQTPAYYDQIIGDVRIGIGGTGRVVVEQPRAAPASPPAPVVAVVPPVVPPAPAPTPRQGAAGNPVANFTRSGAGWHAYVQLPEPAIAFSWRIGETGEFEEAEMLTALDPRTGRPMPNPSITLPGDQKADTLWVRYQDAFGRMQGPFPIAFNPFAALVASHRAILEQTWTTWVAFRADQQWSHLLYTSHLVAYRCAIKSATLTVEGAAPRPIPLPPCDEANPSALPNGFMPTIDIGRQAKRVTVQIDYADGTQSRPREFRR